MLEEQVLQSGGISSGVNLLRAAVNCQSAAVNCHSAAPYFQEQQIQEPAVNCLPRHLPSKSNKSMQIPTWQPASEASGCHSALDLKNGIIQQERRKDVVLMLLIRSRTSS
uniref:Uncharacterized protein n=1 Tax=Spumella elongata TaxID=89044 RepID=A0A7S3HD83_9STRA|mmetsp:Transcript_45939/g.80277  ORF Transcript_45939/g.80277 Transcript_45939/m.80277 type:complete len:110 (+) Transcript_45939:71-400(+)